LFLGDQATAQTHHRLAARSQLLAELLKQAWQDGL
jgi:hypothetical protein